MRRFNVRLRASTKSAEVRGAASKVERLLTRFRFWLLAVMGVVLAFACSGGGSMDDLPHDCESYVETTTKCLNLGEDRVASMRNVFRARIREATDRGSVVNECKRGSTQLAKVCHAH